MTRRSPGEGSIAKRRDGRWSGRYVANGKRRAVYAKSRREVTAKLAAALELREYGLAGRAPTVAEYLDGWLARAAVRPITRVRYEGLLRLHILPAIGAIELRRLRPDHIAALYGALPLAPATVGQIHAVLHGAFRQALIWNLVARNPADGVRPPKAERPAIRVLTIPEAHALLTAVRGDDLEALYVLALTTGARQGELLALYWEDIADGTIRIRYTLTRGKRVSTKTAASVRTIPLTRLAADALRSHRLRMAERLLPLRGRTEGEQLVFCDAFGDPLYGPHITERAFKPLLRRHGLPEIRFHDLRHAAASLMLSRGVPPLVVSRMLGHTNVGTTLNIYGHLLPGDMEAAAQAVQEVLSA
jgi:integrase